MAITEFGKRMRQYRIDAEVSLRDMAEYLKISAAYLSAMEIGKKPITDQVVEGSVKYFRKFNILASDLRRLADSTRGSVDVDDLDGDSRIAVAAFARKLPGMSKDQKNQLTKLLNLNELKDE